MRAFCTMAKKAKAQGRQPAERLPDDMYDEADKFARSESESLDQGGEDAGDTDDEEAVLDLEDDEADDSDADLEAGGQLSKGEPAASAHVLIFRRAGISHTARDLSAELLANRAGAIHAVLAHACVHVFEQLHGISRPGVSDQTTLGHHSCVLAVQ